MALSDYSPPSAEIAFPGGSFRVRGLSVEDVSVLLRSHLMEIDALRETVMAQGSKVLDNAELATLAFDLIREAPAFVATLIALAADEPHAADKVRRLPLTAQFSALVEIGKLTFEDLAGAKNFGATVASLVRGLLPANAALAMLSPKQEAKP